MSLEQYLTRREGSVEPKTRQGSADTFVIQQHITFRNKAGIGFIMFQQDRADTLCFVYPEQKQILHPQGVLEPISPTINKKRNVYLIPVTDFKTTLTVQPETGLELIHLVCPWLKNAHTIDAILKHFKIKKPLPARRKGAQILFYNKENLRIHYDMRFPVDGVLKSFVIPAGFPSDIRSRVTAIQVEDHPLSYAEFEGAIPEGYGMGQVNIYDRGKYVLRESSKDKLKVTVTGRVLRGNYTLLQQKGELWMFLLEKEQAKPTFIQKPLPAVPTRNADLSVSYKYTPTMSPQTKTYSHLVNSVFTKNFKKIYQGEYELLVSSQYNIGSSIYYQVDLDFDSMSATGEISKFIDDLKKNDLVDQFFVQASGGGFHIRSFFAIKENSFAFLKDREFFKKFNYLDIASSFRETPSRVAYAYSEKRHLTSFAFLASDFGSVNISESIGFFSTIPANVLSEREYKTLLFYYMLPHTFLDKEDKVAEKFLAMIA